MSFNEENENNNKNSINNQSNEENKEENTPRENQDDNDNKDENEKKTNGEKDNENKEDINIFKEEAYIYLGKVKNEVLIKEKEDNEFFEDRKGKFKYTICILQETNDNYNSYLLKQTLLSIGKNLNALTKIEITAMEIGVFIFINKFKEDNNINIIKLHQDEEEKNNEYYIQEWEMNGSNEKEDLKDLSNIKIFTINSLKYLTYIKSLSYYYDILRQIKAQNKIMFSSIMTTGVTFSENKLIELISYSYHDKKKHGIAVSSVEYKEKNLVSKLCSYDKMRFNIYNLNYISESNAPFISSQLSLITLNDNLLKNLNEEYYKVIDHRASID